MIYINLPKTPNPKSGFTASAADFYNKTKTSFASMFTSSPNVKMPAKEQGSLECNINGLNNLTGMVTNLSESLDEFIEEYNADKDGPNSYTLSANVETQGDELKKGQQEILGAVKEGDKTTIQRVDDLDAKMTKELQELTKKIALLQRDTRGTNTSVLELSDAFLLFLGSQEHRGNATIAQISSNQQDLLARFEKVAEDLGEQIQRKLDAGNDLFPISSSANISSVANISSANISSVAPVVADPNLIDINKCPNIIDATRRVIDSCKKEADSQKLAGIKQGAQANELIISGLSTKVTALQRQVKELEERDEQSTETNKQLTDTIEELNGDIEMLRIMVSFLNTTIITQSGNVVEDTTISIFTFFITIMLLFSILCAVGFVAPYFYRKGKEEVELAVAERQQDINQRTKYTRQKNKDAPKNDNPYAVVRRPPAPNSSLSDRTRSMAEKLTFPLESNRKPEYGISAEVPKTALDSKIKSKGESSPARKRLNKSKSSVGGKRRTRKHKKYITKRRQLRKIRRTGKKRHRNSKKFRMNK
jgi:hypothetical protein